MDFFDILNIISKDFNEAKCKKFIDILEDYYEKIGKHRYSDVTQWILSLEDSQEYVSENLRILYKNMDYIYKKLQKDNILKLIDHIEMELRRLAFIESAVIDCIEFNNNNINKVYSNMNSSINDIKSRISISYTEIEEIKSNTKDIYTQFIAILGVFSAIVLIFFGGLTGVTGIFNNIKDIGSYVAVFFISLIGIIVFNSIIAFMFILGKLIGKNIFDNSEREARYIKKYIRVINFILVILLILSFVAKQF